MKHSNPRLIACLFLIFPLFGSAPPDKAFSESSFHTAQAQANTNNKDFFAVFEYQDCSPCQWLDTHTFQDPGVDWYIRQNYVGVKVDIKSAEGNDFMIKYKIERTPTVIVFDEFGDEKGRLDQPQNHVNFLHFLKNPTDSKYQINRNAEWHSAENNAEHDSPSNYESPTGSPETTVIEPLPAPSSGGSLEEEMSTPPTTSSQRYTVQIGAFSTREKAFSEMRRLDNEFGKMMLYKPEITNGKQYFKLSVGAFANRNEADILKNKIRNMGFSDAWVKAF